MAEHCRSCTNCPLSLPRLLNAVPQNQEIYESVFEFVPSNGIKTWNKWQQLKEDAAPPDPEKMALLQEVRGHLCTHPLYFLSDEPSTVREGFVDDALYQ